MSISATSAGTSRLTSFFNFGKQTFAGYKSDATFDQRRKSLGAMSAFGLVFQAYDIVSSQEPFSWGKFFGHVGNVGLNVLGTAAFFNPVFAMIAAPLFAARGAMSLGKGLLSVGKGVLGAAVSLASLDVGGAVSSIMGGVLEGGMNIATGALDIVSAIPAVKLFRFFPGILAKSTTFKYLSPQTLEKFGLKKLAETGTTATKAVEQAGKNGQRLNGFLKESTKNIRKHTASLGPTQEMLTGEMTRADKYVKWIDGIKQNVSKSLSKATDEATKDALTKRLSSLESLHKTYNKQFEIAKKSLEKRGIGEQVVKAFNGRKLREYKIFEGNARAGKLFAEAERLGVSPSAESVRLFNNSLREPKVAIDRVAQELAYASFGVKEGEKARPVITGVKRFVTSLGNKDASGIGKSIKEGMTNTAAKAVNLGRDIRHKADVMRGTVTPPPAERMFGTNFVKNEGSRLYTPSDFVKSSPRPAQTAAQGPAKESIIPRQKKGPAFNYNSAVAAA